MKRFVLSLLLPALLAIVSGCARDARLVAVTDFQNLTGDTDNDYLEGVLAETLTSYLANSGGILLRDRQDIYLSFDEIDASGSEAERFNRLRTMGKKVGAEYIVCGSLSRFDKNFVLTARIFGVRAGNVLPGSAISVACTQQYELYDRAQNVGAFLVSRLQRIGAMTPAPAPEEAENTETIPPEPDTE